MTPVSGKRAVWKYTLGPGTQVLHMPAGYYLLHVHEQEGQVCLWAEVTPGVEKIECWVDVRATGQEFSPVSDLYIGTVHLGSLVFHAYELTA